MTITTEHPADNKTWYTQETAPDVEMEIDWLYGTIDIWGGRSCFSGDQEGQGDVYYIEFERAKEDWVKHLGRKRWMNQGSLLRFHSLLEVVQEHVNKCARMEY